MLNCHLQTPYEIIPPTVKPASVYLSGLLRVGSVHNPTKKDATVEVIIIDDTAKVEFF
jgi:hypothetical protein